MANVDPNKYGSSSGVNVNANVGDLVGLFTGKSGSSTDTGATTTKNSGAITNTGSTTTSSSMDPDAMAAMLKTILESTSGLASTAMGEHTAGLYNSSTNQMLVNDLLTRSAAQVAQNAKTSTTTQNTAATDTRGSVSSNTGTKTTVQNPAVKPGTAAKAATVVGALSLVPKSLRDSITTKIGSLGKGVLGGSDTSGVTTTDNTPDAGSGVDSATDTTDVGAPSQSADVTPVTTGGDTDYTPDAGSGVDIGNDASSAADTISSAGDAGDVGSFSDYATGIGDGGEIVSDAGDAASSVGDVDWGSFFAADGGLVDPNRPDGPRPVSNLNFAQRNIVAQTVARSMQPRSTAAGYADGGAADNIFTRRTASIDAQTDAAVNGTATPQATAPQQPASAPAPAVYQSKPHPIMDALFKTIRSFSGGGLAYDDGGKVDLTNLGLLINPSAAKAPTGLSVLNSPTDTTADTSGVTGPTDQGTGFSNTSNLAPVGKTASAGPQTSTNNLATAITPKTATAVKSPQQGNTAAGDSSTTSGQAVGGIDSNPQSVQNAAVTIGLSALGLGILAPIVNAIAAPSAASSGTAASTAAASTSTGSVSVGDVSAADDGPQGTMSADGMTGDDSGVADTGSATSDAAGPAGASTSDGGISGDSGIGGPGDGASAGDSTSASAGDAGSGDSFAAGGVIGAGDETSDSVPAKLSNGEFVMNAEATARYRPFLEMLNNAFKAR